MRCICVQTLKDCTKVHNKMRMVSPCLSSLMRRAALNSLRKLRLMKLFYSAATAQPQRECSEGEARGWGWQRGLGKMGEGKWGVGGAGKRIWGLK